MSLENALEVFRNKNILLTGGAGFVASHLAEKLTSVSDNVVSLDNYLSGRISNHIKGVRYVEGDVNNVVNIFSGYNFDYIFHFGEYSRVEKSLEEPHTALSNIHKSFSSILEFWQDTGAKLIYSGSSTKFADQGNGRFLSPYTMAKSQNADMLVHFAKWYGLSYSLVYFYNVYGGRELRSGKYSTVVGKFKRLVSEGATTLPITSPGTQRRNFTHIDDIINGVILAAAYGQGDGYGIGADEAFSIIDICNKFGCEPNFQIGSPANRMDGILHTDKIKDLGWSQKHSFGLHIREFLDDIKKCSG